MANNIHQENITAMQNYLWRILLIDDDEDDYFITREMLAESRQGKFVLEWKPSFEDGEKALLTDVYEAVLIDYDLGNRTGIDLIRESVSRGCPSPFILLTGHGSYEVDIEAMQAGAADYLNKREINPALLERSIRYAIDRRRSETALLQANIRIQQERDRLNTLIESMSDEVWFCDTHGRIILANSAARKNLGFQDAREILQPLDKLLSNELEICRPDGSARPIDEAPLFQALKGKSIQGEEIARHRVTHELHYREYSANPIRSTSGEVLGAISVVRDITERKQAEQMLLHQHELDARLEVQRLLVVQREQERMQIARDLHDGPIQNLGALLFTIQSALALTEDNDVRQLLHGMRSEVQRLTGELREVCNQLRPPVLAKFGLAKAILAHIEEVQQKPDCPRINLDLDDDMHQTDDPHLPDDARLALFRIFQESMNNILRHAQAATVDIHLRLEPGLIALEIIDDGDGFLIPADWLHLARHGHLGLVGMKERAEAVGGTLTVTSQPGQGTQVHVNLPWGQARLFT